MITLTPEQRRELIEPGPVWVLDPQTGHSYVLVPADVFERIRTLLAPDDFDDAATLINEVMADDDDGDPWLEGYQNLGKEV